MVTRLGFLPCLAAVLLAGGARTARADEPQEIVAPRRMVVSVERLYGYAYEWTAEGATTRMSATHESGAVVGLMGGGAASYVAPRVAFDLFVAKGLTLGLGVGYAWTSLHSTIGSQSGQNDTGHALTFAPRLGYFFPVLRSVSLWPRLGFTAEWSRGWNLGTRGYYALDFYALTLEAPVVIRVSAHLLLTVGPTLDLGLGGAASGRGLIVSPPPPNPSWTFKETDVGVTGGFAGYF